MEHFAQLAHLTLSLALIANHFTCQYIHNICCVKDIYNIQFAQTCPNNSENVLLMHKKRHLIKLHYYNSAIFQFIQATTDSREKIDMVPINLFE